jgi:hypothetical protein
VPAFTATINRVTHTSAGGCCKTTVCPKCRRAVHRQPVLGGTLYLCEGCDRDRWGTPTPAREAKPKGPAQSPPGTKPLAPHWPPYLTEISLEETARDPVWVAQIWGPFAPGGRPTQEQLNRAKEAQQAIIGKGRKQ